MTSFAPADSLWAATAPQPPKTLPLQTSAKADVAIIGAGFTGLSAALHLAQQGVSVVVLEAMEIGHGGSGRNKGLVNAGMWVLPDDLPATLGAPHGERLLNLARRRAVARLRTGRTPRHELRGGPQRHASSGSR